MRTSSPRPLHERIAPLGRIRGALRRSFFALLGRIAGTDDARAILHRVLPDLHDPPHGLGLDPGTASPYPDLGRSPAAPQPCRRDDLVIITARFRSGSTLLWNLFREIPSCTAFYEPFNERRWFDPDHRQGHTDPTHRGVNDYWREYEPLPHLASLYREEWIDRRLFMGPRAWDPAMQAYLEAMVEGAPGRPVFQFNRMDFRLPWIRRRFPRATLLHLYRHPRDAWMSSLVNPAAYPQGASMAAFASADHFYLLNWAQDLKHGFPFLDPASHDHAYDLFYCIWKLSYLFGTRYAHRSVSFEDLALRPRAVLPDLLAHLGIPDADLDHLVALVDPPAIGKWLSYADDGWFAARETRCEGLLAEFLRGADDGGSPAAHEAALALLAPGAR
jgi:Sulfotransferase family